MKQVSFLAMTTALALGAVSLDVTAARAGFQWHAPAPVAAIPVPAPVVTAPSAPDEAMGPVINWQQGPEDTPVSSEPLAAVAPAPVEATPAPVATPKTSPPADIVWQEPQPVAAVPVAQTVLTDKSNDPGAVVEGFGDGITLVMAMRDIAPAQYQFSFGKEVNLSAPADWQGGRPWKAVMTDVLQAQGLRAAIYGQMIVVSGGDVPPPLPPPGDVASSDVAIAPMPVVNTPVSVAPQRPSQDIVRENYDARTHEAMISQMTKSPVRGAPAPVYTPPDALMPLPLAKPQVAISHETAMAPSVPSEKPVAVAPQVAASEVKPAVNDVPVREVAPLYSSVATVYGTKEKNADVMVVTPPDEKKSDEKISDEKVAVAVSTPVPAAEMPVVADADNMSWRADESAFLHDVLKEWADRAGVKLIWTIDYDYKMPKTRDFSGSFDQAVAGLLNGFGKVRPQPYGALHRAKDGSSATLVIKSY